MASLPAEQKAHPEHMCERCHGSNVTWFAPSDIWNAVHADFDILCPLCFISMAEAAGFNKDAWRIAPEFHHETAPSRADVLQAGISHAIDLLSKEVDEYDDESGNPPHELEFIRRLSAHLNGTLMEADGYGPAPETSVPSRYEQHLAGLLASALAYGAEPLPTTWREEAARYLNERGCPVETSAPKPHPNGRCKCAYCHEGFVTWGDCNVHERSCAKRLSEKACGECGGRGRLTVIRIGNEVNIPCPSCSQPTRGGE